MMTYAHEHLLVVGSAVPSPPEPSEQIKIRCATAASLFHPRASWHHFLGGNGPVFHSLQLNGRRPLHQKLASSSSLPAGGLM